MNIKKPIFWDKKEPNYLAYILYPITFLLKLTTFSLNFLQKKIWKNKINMYW